MPVRRTATSPLALFAQAAALLAAVACGAPPRPPAPTSSVPAGATFTVLLPAGTADAPALVVIPADATQIVLRLVGETGDPSELILETAPVAAPDEARRWAVDVAAASGDGAAASVTLPAFALAPGDLQLTLWRGDAEVVRRQTVRVTRP